MVYAAEKTLTDLGEKAPADLKGQVEDAAAKVREVKDGEDLEAIKNATDALSQVMQKLGEAAYAQTAQSQPPNPESQGEATADEKPGDDDEDVVEGEYKQV
jgi:molecular chaperone DnaK